MTEETSPEVENVEPPVAENAAEIVSPPVKYASFEVRIIAAAIDLFIIMLFAAPIIEWSMDALFSPLDYNNLAASLGTPDELIKTPEKYVPQLWDAARSQHVIERSLLDNGLQLFFIALYTIPFWFRRATTPGKMLLRLEILDATTFEKITHIQAVKRFLGYIVSFIPFTLGFMWIMFNKKRQGWHDKLANTVVVVKPKQQKLQQKI